MKRKLLSVAILAVSIFLVTSLAKQVWSTVENSQRLDQARVKLAQEEGKNTQLKDTLSYLESNNFVEREARDKLGLSKTGETVVIIPQEVLAKQVSSPKDLSTEIPNWQRWWRLFFD